MFAFLLNVVFNEGMSTIIEDKKIILELGGPTEVARLLGLDTSNGGVQRVQNWMSRGIPPKEKLARPDLFLRDVFPATEKLKPRTGPDRRKPVTP